MLFTWYEVNRASSNHIKYVPRPDATPESELNALAAVYAFVLECHERQKVADPIGDPNEAKEVQDNGPTQRLPH